MWALGKAGNSKSLQVLTPCQLPGEQKYTHSLFSVSLHSVPISSLLLGVFSLLGIGEEKDRQVGEEWP